MLSRALSPRLLAVFLAGVACLTNGEESVGPGTVDADTVPERQTTSAESLIFLRTPAEGPDGSREPASGRELVPDSIDLDQLPYPSIVSIRACEEYAGKVAVMSWNEPRPKAARLLAARDNRHYRVIVKLDCTDLPKYGRITDPRTGKQVSFTCIPGKLAGETSCYNFTAEEEAAVATLRHDLSAGTGASVAYEDAFTKWSNSIRPISSNPAQSRFLLWFCGMLKNRETTVEEVTPGPSKFKGKACYNVLSPGEVSAALAEKEGADE